MNAEDKVMRTLTIGMLVALFSAMAMISGRVMTDLYTYYQCQVNLNQAYCAVRNQTECATGLFESGPRCHAVEEK